MKLRTAPLSIVLALVVLAIACDGTPQPTPTPRRPSPPPPPPAPESIVKRVADILQVGTEIAPTPTPSVSGAAGLGIQVADRQGCLGCHTTDGTILIGPTWKGLFGKTEQLEGGDTVTVDEAYLEESIKNPGAKVVNGFQNIMPAVSLSQNELEALIAYIRSLE